MIKRLRAWVRNGRIETEGPLSFPEGMELMVSPAVQDDLEWDNSPEGIRQWLAWYDSLEPLAFTPEERQQWEEAQADRKAWELSHADQHEQKLRGLWK